MTKTKRRIDTGDKDKEKNRHRCLFFHPDMYPHLFPLGVHPSYNNKRRVGGSSATSSTLQVRVRVKVRVRVRVRDKKLGIKD